MEQIKHVMTDEEKVEAVGHITDIASAMGSLEALCEYLCGDEMRAKAAMPVIIEVARSTAARADRLLKLVVS